ncbi:MAG: hypothetical protein ACYCWW_09830 [Deltaproteobacteria bacterium]
MSSDAETSAETILVSVHLRGDGADSEPRLRLEMGRAGFSGTIRREDGTRFRLPSGVFRFAGDGGADLQFVRNLATSIARQIDGDAAILAVQAKEWSSAGLKVKSA